MAVEILSEKDFNCRECDDTLKKERGCEAEGIVPFYINDERYFRCPLKLISPLSYEYITAFRFYEKGKFPNGEAWLRESRKYLEAMAVVDNVRARLEQSEIKRVKHGK